MPSRRAVLLLVPFLGSCGTLMTTGSFHVPVDSEPRGAAVVYGGEIVGWTPCVVAMHRGAPWFELRHSGCHPRRVDVGTTRNPWLAVNLVTCGLGGFVDIALGTDVALVDDPVKVHLADLDSPVPAAWIRALPTSERWAPQPAWTGFDLLLYVIAGIGQAVYDNNR